MLANTEFRSVPLSHKAPPPPPPGISQLADSDDSTYEEIGVQASEIKNAFLDDRKSLEDVIPSQLLLSAASRNEVAPRKQAPFVDSSP